MAEYNKLIFEIGRPGRVAYSLPESDVDSVDLEEKLPKHLIRDEEVNLPEVSELELMRHYVALSKKNFGVEDGFYPLGSCTMDTIRKSMKMWPASLVSPASILTNRKKRYRVRWNSSTTCKKSWPLSAVWMR